MCYPFKKAQLRRAAELREKSERDAIELKSYRKSLDFHAIPIMKMNPVTVERSEKELTSPHTVLYIFIILLLIFCFPFFSHSFSFYSNSHGFELSKEQLKRRRKLKIE